MDNVYDSLSTQERIRGCLFGLAWGDVFGCPVEGWKESQIKSFYKKYECLPDEYPLGSISTSAPKQIKRLRPLGMHSDDTQQCLALLNCCITSDYTWDKHSWCQWLKLGMTTDAWRGYGRNFVQSVRNVRKGVKPEECGSPSAGIGAAMRIGPMGALFRDNLDQLQSSVWESSLITHGTILAASMAYAVAFTVNRFIMGDSLDKIRMELPSAVSEMEKKWLLEKPEWKIDREDYHYVSLSLRTIFDDPKLLDLSELRKFISANARGHLADGFTRAHVNQGFVGLGGLHAVCAALLPNIQPQQLLTDIVSLGCDTDTVGAIAGTILGARFGYSWIPIDRFIDKSRLCMYADELVARGSAKIESREEFMDHEAALTKQEDMYQNRMAKQYGKPRNKKKQKKQKKDKRKGEPKQIDV